MKCKRLILFGFDAFYPMGGMNDYLIAFNNLEEMIELLRLDKQQEIPRYDCDRFNVLDTKYFKVGRGTSPTQAFSNLSN